MKFNLSHPHFFKKPCPKWAKHVTTVNNMLHPCQLKRTNVQFFWKMFPVGLTDYASSFFFSSNVAETFRHLGCKRSKIDTNCPKIPKQQPHMHVQAFVRCVYPRRLDTGTQCTVHANTWASSHICHKTLCCSHPYAAYITLPKKTHLTQPSPQS